MKIRNGFVSNSSSSSFIIYGIKLSIDEVNKLAENLEQKYPDPDYSNCLLDAVEDLDLFAYWPEYNEREIYIGLSVITTYNESIEEVPELTQEQKLDTKKKLESMGIEKELKLYVCGSSS